METYDPPKKVEEKVNNSELPEQDVISEKWLLEKIDSLIPLIQEKWPNICLLYTLTLPTIALV